MKSLRAGVPSVEAFREAVRNAYEEGWTFIGGGSILRVMMKDPEARR